MKKTTSILAVILVLTLLLSACTGVGEPTEPTQPQASTPTDTQPTESLPPEPTESGVTESEPTEPEEEDTEPEGELYDVDREGHYVFEEPSFDSRCVQGLPAGVYTIMETKTDDEGNTWGKLKSGMGWICLTEIQQAAESALPVAIVEAYDLLLKGDRADSFELFPDEYCYKLAFFAYEKLTDVKLSLVDVFAEDSASAQLKWEQASLTKERPVVLHLAFPGDFTTYELTFTDESGAARTFRIMQSGRNGVIFASEVE